MFVSWQVIAGAGLTAAQVDYEQFRTDLDHVADQSHTIFPSIPVIHRISPD
jgi:hypothetical protein